MHNGPRSVAPIRASFSLLYILLLCSSLPAVAQLEPIREWESALYADNPLVGRIWSSASADFIDSQQLIQSIEGASYLLLGEKHDNPDHHALQLLLLEHVISQGRANSIAFEMMDSDAQELLDDIGQQELATLSDLKTYLGWDEEAWDWEFYGPLLQAVYAADLPLTAANITSATMGRVYSEETPPAIARVFDAETMQQLNQDIDESHCGLLLESQFPAMVRVQQTRDYTMANSMAIPATGKTTLLIAGNYHVRHDLGVPNYLLARDGQLQRSDILALSFMEVGPGEEDPSAYLQQFKSQPAFDYIWFTPAISDEDYCASLQ